MGTFSKQIDDGLVLFTGKFHQVSKKIESKLRLIQAKGTTKQFTCPICLFEGRFVTDRKPFASRYAAICPRCQSVERHRTQFLAMEELRKTIDFAKLSVLHVAPEMALRPILQSWFGTYTTADINPGGVDLVVDLTDADLPDKSFDVVYASHVLQEIREDRAALKEIARILKPGGFAVLPVPLVGEVTVEFSAPVPTEFGFVRVPGYDYYERYPAYFSSVMTFSSEDFDEQYQPYVYEDRSRYPTRAYPYRTPSRGARHRDVVPIAFV